MYQQMLKYDDFESVSDGPSAPNLDVPLITIARNEMYFLTEFLRHYRGLGVTHFFILDDQSDDGSQAYLEKQNDVTLIMSGRRYGDLLPDLFAGDGTKRAATYWRTLLSHRYGAGRYVLMCDVDEFIQLPPGMDFPTIIEQLKKNDEPVLYGAMIDMYPPDYADLVARGRNAFSLKDNWQYDAKPHVITRKGRRPYTHYPSARARLSAAHGLIAQGSSRKRVSRKISGRHFARIGMMHKPIVNYVSPDFFYKNAHKVSHVPNMTALLPIEHYKFTPAIAAKIEDALKSGAYSGGSKEYVNLDGLMRKMAEDNARFSHKFSSADRSWDGYKRSGNARWPG